MITNFLCRHNRPIAWAIYLLFAMQCTLAAEGATYPAGAGYYRPAGTGYHYPVTPRLPAAKPFMAMTGEKRDDNGPQIEVTPPITVTSPITVTPGITVAPHKDLGGGPTQPEMQAFQSVNANNMVDLFSGDFSYNIPLMDVGGYPVNIAYRGGISMDQEASWVGLGWNVNPGTITRNLRGVPDDFNGSDSIKKVASIKENKTIGITSGGGGNAGDLEVVGFPVLPINLGANYGIFHNTYKGWGLNVGVNATINAGDPSKGSLTGGLGLAVDNNSQNGLTLTPSLSLLFNQEQTNERASLTGSLSTSLAYNSRSGLKDLSLSMGQRQSYIDASNQHASYAYQNSFSSYISFAGTAYTPTITMPLTNRQFTFTAKLGEAVTVVHASGYLSGYSSSQRIDPPDTSLALPAYGYLHYQDGAGNASALLDMNREKELPYHDKPPIPHIAVPLYTYDAWSITGEGTGGMFRAYRGDIGVMHDHFIRTKDASDRFSIDVGIEPHLVHAGVDLNVTRAFTQNGPWTEENSMQNVMRFRKDSGLFEAAYFRNPGEKSINSAAFYNAIGGDDVVAVKLFQPGNSSSLIQATNYLTHYRNKLAAGDSLLTPQKAIRPARDKRTQVISYLNAQEADATGLSKYIESYALNQFSLTACPPLSENETGSPTGLLGEYFPNETLKGIPTTVVNDTITHDWDGGAPAVTVNPLSTPAGLTTFPADHFSVRWTGRIQAPETGTYTFQTPSDDGVRLWINDSLLIDKWSERKLSSPPTKAVNLVGGEMYRIRLEMYEHGGEANVALNWKTPGQSTFVNVPRQYFYPAAQTSYMGMNVTREKRINNFRKANHVSEIDVLNNDGRRYVYGIPVYNLRQKEATFAVDHTRGNRVTGLVGYQGGIENTAANNKQGKDNYFNSEEIPAYAHSFLLTGILSPDYVDRTGNGISDDDAGDAVRFNYSKVSGINKPYRWRTPYAQGATYNEGMRTDSRDDKGNYVYGEKELWYLHTIESKTMIATFTVANRCDGFAIDENGVKQKDSSVKRLKEINLYSKADFLKNGTSAIPIKTVHFEYSYELCRGINAGSGSSDSGKLTLKRIWFTYNGNDKGKQNPYVFNYNSLNPTYNIRSYDRWGNYKDPAQNPNPGHGDPINNAEYPYSLQDSTMAAQNAAAWTLDSVSLPSGGAIKVAYESDDYAYVQNKRAMDLFGIAGLGPDSILSHSSTQLYGASENLYVFVNVPKSVTTKTDLYQKYLAGVSKLYFKLFVRMPDDQWGSGSEYVPCYADLDAGNSYGVAGPGTIWLRIAGISLAGDQAGSFSPLAKAAIQFLRMNLPSKAYPGSEPGDNLDVVSAVRMIFALVGNVATAFTSFDKTARGNKWCQTIDLDRSWIRLDNPLYKKYGGGHRVKRITIYDKWDKMVTGQRPAMYGQEYTYTTQQEIGGVMTTISSGVASYEPGIGGEENPFRQPIEYVEQIAPLGPVTLGYSEEPLGESVFPSAGVGYSKVRVRTINFKNRRSANGYEETMFYTAYDFPTLTDRSLLDNDTKKRYKPTLANLLRIDARNYLTMSQGFKVELNDMHGKLRSQAYYPETDPVHYTSYTENFYKVENPAADVKRLANTVTVIHPDGSVDTTFIGKDAELMVDMREQLSITNGYNIDPNADIFPIPFIPPVIVIPSLINLPQREEDRFRSVATLKVIQRYGILDSVIHIDKGSKVSTKDLLYDSETGDVLLTRTQNEFNDPVYNFSYPSHWAYDGMGLAYQNIGLSLQHINITEGKMTNAPVADTLLFSGGDEILVAGNQPVGATVSCVTPFATFPDYTRIWAIDSSTLNGGRRCIFFIDKDGKPYNANDVYIKVIRSGRRNMLSTVGTVTTLANPLGPDPVTGKTTLVLSGATKVLNAASSEFTQFWKVDDNKSRRTIVNCVSQPPADCSEGGCLCICLRQLFKYLIASRRLFTTMASHVTVSSLVSDANSAGFTLSTSDCSILSDNASKFFYATTPDTTGTTYHAMIGSCEVSMSAPSAVPFNQLTSSFCGVDGVAHFTYTPPPGGSCPRFKVYYQVPDDGATFEELHPSDDVQDCSGEVHTFVVDLTGFTPGDVVLAEEVCGEFITHHYNRIESETPLCTVDTAAPVDVQLTVGNCTSCDTLASVECYSTVTDTVFNPYVAGVLGNFRGTRNYTYFGPRAETDPSAATDIRHNGAFQGFAPFWALNGGRWKPQYDTTRWVWNSELTLFNKKGMEIENRDPLGRYNAIQYGYNLTLPVAVTQNGHYREAAFEGFEDYGFLTQICDTSCPAARHIDYTPYLDKITTAQKHSGKSSLKLNASEQAGLAFSLTGADTAQATLTFTTATDGCLPVGPALTKLNISNKVLLPTFSPFKGRQMVLSAWVKEEQACTCTSYANNAIQVVCTGGSGATFTFHPAGNIIEGWQRYEALFTIPADATGISVNLEATGSTAVFFDDLRLHPVNANMKSFVYNPVNLRLMAEQDENNYSTFYEYDDDGTLIRVKKETERGIQTIKETRSALLKQ